MGVFILDQSKLAGGVQWLYGLQEQSGTRAGDVSGAGDRPRLTRTRKGTGGSADFGYAGISPEGTMLRLDPQDSGGYTFGATGVRSALAGGWTVLAQFALGSSAPEVRLLRIGGGAACLDVYASRTAVRVVAATDTDTTTITKTTPIAANQPHMVVIVGGRTAGQIAVHVDSTAAATGTGGSLGSCQGLTLGDPDAGTDGTHYLAWVGYVAEALDESRVSDLTTLGTGAAERSDLRIGRLLRWVGVEDVDLETGASDVAYQNCGGSDALSLVAEVQKVEHGVLFTSGDGRLVSHSRQHRWNRPSAVTLDASDIDPAGFLIEVDRQRMVNDASLSRPGGATARVVNRTSRDLYGRRTPQDGSILAASDDDLQAAAEYMVNVYGEPGARVSRVRVNLLTHDADFAAAILGLEVGDRITLTGLPDQAPDTTLDLFVEGMTEEIRPAEWWIELHTSPAGPASIFTLDSATYGLDVGLLAY